MTVTAGKHRPVSHPVVRRTLAMADIEDSLDSNRRIGRLVQDPAGDARERLTYQIEELARHVVTVPDEPLTVLQRNLMRAIARELLRRVTAP
ncbi:MAG TPA: hypothetical protein VEW95_05420 [Candidatus Limnocylindrales bacterium]|nr:hypothetical protein [Candidatus Limnocylindrales bacterium]